MKLMILTCAVYPSEEIARKKLWIFLKSCEKYGIEPHLYGIGHPWTIYRHIKLDLQFEYLAAQTEDFTHVLYTDSWDAFFTGSINEIIAKYKELGMPPILSSAYSGLANVSEPDKDYPNCFDKKLIYRHPHVGGYIAEIPAITKAFKRMLDDPNPTSDDCFDWYKGWKEGWFRPALDSQCEIFQVTAENVSLHTDERRLYNHLTGSFPCVLHVSGGYTDPETGKDDRLIPWAERLGIL